jgi:rubrerythrin
MKLLMRCEHAIAAAHLAGALRAAGIDCEVRNTTLAGAIGEIPFLECAPQLWLRNALDEPRARELIAQLRRPVDGDSWTCAVCGELLEPQFSQCWNCGASRP